MRIKVELKHCFWADVEVEADDHAHAAELVRAMDTSSLYQYVHDERVEIFDTVEVFEAALCPDCGTDSTVELIGTVCLSCTRGIIKGVGQ